MTTIKANANVNTVNNVAVETVNTVETVETVETMLESAKAELKAKREQRNAANAKRAKDKAERAEKEAEKATKKPSKKDQKLSKKEIAKAEKAKKVKDAAKAKKAAERELNKGVRESEKETKAVINADFKTYRKQFTVMFDYVMNGFFDNHFKALNITLTDEQKITLMKSIKPREMFVCAPIVSVCGTVVNGVLNRKKVVLRAETELNSELYTFIYVAKTTFTLNDLLAMFFKLLRKKYTTMQIKTEKVEQTNIEYMTPFEVLENNTLIAYNESKLSPDAIKERVTKL